MNKYETMKKIICKEIELNSDDDLYQLVEEFKRIHPMAVITFFNGKKLRINGIPNPDVFGKDFLFVNQPKVETGTYKSLKLMDGTVHKITRNKIVEYEQWMARMREEIACYWVMENGRGE